MQLAFNDLYSGFPVTMKWKPIPHKADDPPRDPRHDQPSGLTHVRLPAYDAYRILDFTGTTNEEALKKLLDFYSDPHMAESCGDHVYFEGFYQMHDGTFGILWGS
jgi:hypothetical protein